MALAVKTENYFDEAYWDNRYARDAGSFDWYQQYRGLAPLIKMYTKTTDEVLMVGCGSSLLSEEMAKDGYKKIMNIDISNVLIQIMTLKYKNFKQLQYKRMDVRHMREFKDESYACVLDKGMFDNLIVRTSLPKSVLSLGSTFRPFVLIISKVPLNACNSVELVHKHVWHLCYQKCTDFVWRSKK